MEIKAPVLFSFLGLLWFVGVICARSYGASVCLVSVYIIMMATITRPLLSQLTHTKTNNKNHGLQNRKINSVLCQLRQQQHTLTAARKVG